MQGIVDFTLFIVLLIAELVRTPLLCVKAEYHRILLPMNVFKFIPGKINVTRFEWRGKGQEEEGKNTRRRMYVRRVTGSFGTPI